MANNTINNCTFAGYLGSRPKLLKTKAGKDYVALSVATNEEYFDKATKKKVQGTVWIPVLIFGGYAEIASKYLDIGTYVIVATRYRTVQKSKNEFVSYFVLKDDSHALKFINKAHSEQELQKLQEEVPSTEVVTPEDISELDESIKGD